jgi:hypothetical protein
VSLAGRLVVYNSVPFLQGGALTDGSSGRRRGVAMCECAIERRRDASDAASTPRASARARETCKRATLNLPLIVQTRAYPD